MKIGFRMDFKRILSKYSVGHIDVVGLWNNEQCETTYGYICKREEGASVVVTDQTTPPVNGSCPPGYIGISK